MNKMKTRSSYENRELLHESLRNYVSEVLTHGLQTKTTEIVISAAFESILKEGSVSDIEWATKRISRAIGALDEGEYSTIHAHQENFERMIQALGFQKTIAAMASRGWG
jgi:hypothetical protein